jgi:hypothetical protein
LEKKDEKRERRGGSSLVSWATTEKQLEEKVISERDELEREKEPEEMRKREQERAEVREEEKRQEEIERFPDSSPITPNTPVSKAAENSKWSLSQLTLPEQEKIPISDPSLKIA